MEASSTSQEYEEWIDKKFEETFNKSAQEDLCKNDESIQKEQSVKRLEAAMERFYPTTAKSPAQQEPINIIGSTNPYPYLAWDPADPYLAWDPAEENSIDSSLGNITVCQLSSSSALRIPITLQGRALKAVVDTAAMVTIVSDTIYREMKPNPPCLNAIANRRA